MKLNNECVRDVLLMIESELDYGHILESDSFRVKSYSSSEITYTLDKLIEAKFVNGEILRNISGEASAFAESLTWDGHKFLDNIRDDGVWKETKSIISKLSSVSIGIISTVSSQVITNLINKHMRI